MKFRSLLTVLLLGTVALTAFATGTQESGGSPEPIDMTVTTPVDHVKAGFEAVVDAINDSDEFNVNLEIDAVAGGQAVEIVMLRFAADEMSDFIELNSTNAIYNDVGGDEPLLPVGGEWEENYDENLLYTTTYYHDGEIRAVPFGGINIGGMLYNRQVFEELGLETPSTHEELLEVAEVIRQETDITPVFVSGRTGWTLQIYPIVGFSREWKDDPSRAREILGEIQRNELQWDDLDLWWDSFKKYKELIDRGYVNETWQSDTYDMAQEALATGQAAMYPMATWVLPDMAEKFSEEQMEKIGAFPIPFDGENHAPAWAPFAFAMTRNVADVEVGRRIMHFIASPAGQKIYFDAQPSIPSVRGLEDVDLLRAQRDLYEIFSMPGRGGLVYQFLGPTDGTEGPKSPWNLVQATQRILTGTTTVEEEAERKTQDFIEAGRDQGIPGF
jgi:raffinose/stachyose/melibiose transport system substrate-binding protein